MSREKPLMHWRKDDNSLACLSKRIGKDSETSSADTWRMTRQEKCFLCASWVSKHFSEVFK